MLISRKVNKTPYHKKSNDGDSSRKTEQPGMIDLVPQQAAEQTARRTTGAETQACIQGLATPLVPAGKKAMYQRYTDRVKTPKLNA